MIIQSAGEGRTAAAIAGVDFDAQDNWCEACRAYHVAATHQEDVPTECEEVIIQGFSSVFKCNREPHEDNTHRTVTGVSWEIVA